MESILVDAILGLQNSRDVRENSIAETGITRQDVLWQNRLIAYLCSLRNTLVKFKSSERNRTAIPCFTEFILEWEFGEGGLVQ